MRKYVLVFGLILGLFCFTAGGAPAATVQFNFSGVVSNDAYLAWGNLITPGDQVSGSIAFELSPPSAANVGGPITGSYTYTHLGVNTTIQMNTLDQRSYWYDYATFVFHGTDNLPTAPTAGATVYKMAVIDGIIIWLRNVDGINDPLSSYLSLGTDDITVLLTGYAYNSQTQQSYDGSFATLDLRSAELSGEGAAAVPEPATMLLLGLGLAGVAAARKRFRK